MPRQTIFILPILLLAPPNFGDQDTLQHLLHIDFGNGRASSPPSMETSENSVPEVLCSDATFPTGTYCNFHSAFQKIGKFPNLNATDKLVLRYPHPTSEGTLCKMNFIGTRHETPARVIYERTSCEPEVAEGSMPPVRMINVTSIWMKLFQGELVCSMEVNNVTVIGSGTEEQTANNFLGFLSFNTTCALPVVFGRPPIAEVVTVYLPDRIRDRPDSD